MQDRDRTNDTEMTDLAPVILMRAVEVEPRLGEGLRVELHGVAVEVQRGEGLVIGVSASTLRRAPLDPYLPRIAAGHAGVLLVGQLPDGMLDALPKNAVIAHVPDLASPDALFVALHGALERVELRVAAERRGRWLTRYRYELGELIEISRAISQERDLDRLLTLILEKSRFITGADAGSIYVLESVTPGSREKRLRFKLSQNESVTFESREFTIPLTTRSVAGAAAVNRKPINIPDVYAIGSDEPFGFDPSFDRKVGYRTRSMIAMPMISAEDDVIGVIQLINKKRDPQNRLSVDTVDREVVPFDQRSEDLLATLASQAGIALENALLYDEIRRIFDGFVRASVQAIEQRDPTTSGHSLRVSVLSCGLAEAVDRITSGPYKDMRFTRRDLKELEYASLLHDFGKIGVREEVLVKAKKLYPHQLDQVRLRFDYVRKSLEAEGWKRKLDAQLAGAGASDLKRIDEELAARAEELEIAWRTVQEANEPTVLKEGDFTRIAELGQRTYVDACGHAHPLLTSDEVVSLQVTKGSLHDREIEEIRSHVVHTFDFLSSIPWGKSFTRIPEIAGAHHEKLNGRGYPKGLGSDQIPVPSKIMTIADIFDALTARDRPYKKAMPVDRALSILGFEVKDGHVDGELVRIFAEAEVFKKVEGDLSY
ncbi:HD domain-containing phosphohydrolase [Sandaracinus amylolyticus]|uniref:HD domain-containing phosphohydrolase n=1 Tax=Sandaracinus amylolyticus TaxID=927083 RepID=UPI002E362D05|nr:HD domain-containing phosphohydrolase [Sandaracinus amylolyticus]UJR78339.1 Cyclic di-GMP phosphodiesterase response regulator RpfG [Sandaracinus amylolyticus]